jgi:hypothetical protein
MPLHGETSWRSIAIDSPMAALHGTEHRLRSFTAIGEHGLACILVSQRMVRVSFTSRISASRLCARSSIAGGTALRSRRNFVGLRRRDASRMTSDSEIVRIAHGSVRPAGNSLVAHAGCQEYGTRLCALYEQMRKLVCGNFAALVTNAFEISGRNRLHA